MSQAAFANYLKVGEASIKRWETYFVQDVVQDDHIRLKCDEAYAEVNAAPKTLNKSTHCMRRCVLSTSTEPLC